jgi:two-component system nitrate/nitrite response regulator NarL
MSLDILILSDIRFVREGLADALGRDGTFKIAGVAVDLEQARLFVSRTPPCIILVDTALPQAISAVETLREFAGGTKIVAFALTETETEVINWALAGISGYIPRDTALSSVVGLLSKIMDGEQVCPTRIAFGMLRWISQCSSPHVKSAHLTPPSGLTLREQEVVHLMSANLSNKEIARHLGIGLATTKSHVHNILAKLGVSKRALAAASLHQRPVRGEDRRSRNEIHAAD